MALSDALTGGEVVGTYDPKPCWDASGAPFDWRSRLYVVQRPGGGRELVEARAQYDALVFQYPNEDGTQRVFQVVVRSRGESPRLHEARIPRGDGSDGSYVVAALREATGSEEKLRAQPGPELVRCDLRPVFASQPVDKAQTTSKLPP